MKKKNLLKCLALTSMLALSVGAVTSCGTQGEAGKDGAQGAQGATGAKGEQGEKGDDGKTYLQVFVTGMYKVGSHYEPLAKALKIDNPQIEIGETFTVTLDETAEGVNKNDLIFDLDINGSVIENPTIGVSYTYTAKEGDTGFQIMGANFGTVANYGTKTINDYYNSLVAADYQLKDMNSTITDFDSVTEGDQAQSDIKSDYYDETVSKVATTQLNVMASFVSSLDSKLSIAEKVAKIKEKYVVCEKAIKDAYDKVVKDAKVVALAESKTLYNDGKVTGTTDPFLAADRAAMKSELDGKIDAATTLQGLADLVSSKSVAGSYDKLEANRSSVFSAITSGLKAVAAKDASFLVAGKDTGTSTTYADLKKTLNDLGITELPFDVAESYRKQASEAKTLDVYTADALTTSKDTYVKGDCVMAYEAKKAIVACYTSIQATLKQNILDKYYAEVDASEVITKTADRDNFKTAILNVVDNWLAGIGINGATDAAIKVTVSNMASYVYREASGTGINAIAAKHDLCGTVEKFLETYNSAFTKERLATAVKAAAVKLSAKVSEIKLGDAGYSKAITPISGTSVSDYTYETRIGPDAEYSVKNEFTPTGSHSALNVNVLLASYLPSSETGGIYSETSVAAINLYETAKETELSDAHDAAVIAYANDWKDTAATSGIYKGLGIVDVGTITAASIKAQFIALFTEDDGTLTEGKLFADVETAVEGAKNWTPLLEEMVSVWTEFEGAVATVIPTATETDVFESASGNAVASTVYYEQKATVASEDVVDGKTVFASHKYEVISVTTGAALPANTFTRKSAVVDPSGVLGSESTASASVLLAETGTIYQSYLGESGSMFADIISGKVTTVEEVTAWKSTLSTNYSTAVATHKAEVIETADRFIHSLVAQNVALGTQIREAYAKWLEALNGGYTVEDDALNSTELAGLKIAYNDKNYTDIDNWLADLTDVTANKGIDKVANNGTLTTAANIQIPSYELCDDAASKLSNYKSYALGLLSAYYGLIEKTTEYAALSSSQIEDLEDIYNTKVNLIKGLQTADASTVDGIIKLVDVSSANAGLKFSNFAGSACTAIEGFDLDGTGSGTAVLITRPSAIATLTGFPTVDTAWTTSIATGATLSIGNVSADLTFTLASTTPVEFSGVASSGVAGISVSKDGVVTVKDATLAGAAGGTYTITATSLVNKTDGSKVIATFTITLAA